MGRFGRCRNALGTESNRPNFTRKADLAKTHQAIGERPVAKTGDDGKQRRQIDGGFVDAQATDDIDEHVFIADRQVAMALQNREQQRESILVHALCEPLRIVGRW